MEGFVALFCTLRASWSSGLSFLETKAGPAPCQRSVSGAGDLEDILLFSSSALPFPPGSVVTGCISAVTAESSLTPPEFGESRCLFGCVLPL